MNIFGNISSLTSPIATNEFLHKINHIPIYIKNFKETGVKLTPKDRD